MCLFCVVIHFLWLVNACFLPSVLWRCWLGGRKGIWPVKNWVVEYWRGYLTGGANLHMAQRMPLPLTVSCFSKIQIGFSFLVPAHLGSPRKRAVKRVCVKRVCIKHLTWFQLFTLLHIFQQILITHTWPTYLHASKPKTSMYTDPGFYFICSFRFRICSKLICYYHDYSWLLKIL